MLVAGKIARALGADIKLIDKPILVTLRDAWKNMPWIEFWRLIKDIIFSFVGGCGELDTRRKLQREDHQFH